MPKTSTNNLRAALPKHDGFNIEPIGHLQLRGRNRTLDVFALRPKV
jgi:hypothetical protein